MKLVRGTGCSREAGHAVFLCDPRWTEAPRARVDALLAAAGSARVERKGGWLCIPTGGSSGEIRFARHDEHTLLAAAQGFAEHFELGRINAIDVLPPFHVSGLMARVRCAASGGVHVPWDWKRLEAGERPSVPAGGESWVISLVPTQLQRLLSLGEAVRWLRSFSLVFLGGGPVWPTLCDTAAREGLRVSLSYGMTETAAMLAAMKPEEFLAGERRFARIMPHARIQLAQDATIRVASEALFRGYFPEWRDESWFETADLGEIDAEGRLAVFGRRDALIISGGEKVNPLEVEAVLRETGQFSDVAVLGVADAEWGEAVVVCYPAAGAAPDLASVRKTAETRLAGFQRPKRYLAVAEWPRNAQGKLNRASLARQLAGAGPA